MEKALIGLIGVVVGALLITLKELFFYRKKRKEEQVYLSIQMIGLLDRFISKCFDVVYDDGLFHGQRGEDGCKRPQVDTPIFEPLSVDVEWKSLPADLMYEILDFPSQIEDADAYISSVWEHCGFAPDYEEVFEARHEKYAELGLKAFDMTSRLRALAGLPDKTYTEWTSQEKLQDLYDRTMREKAEREERQRKANEKLFANLEQSSSAKT